MLFETPPLDAATKRGLARFDELAGRLDTRSGAAGPWLGSLRRQWRAALAASSIEIEGYSVPEDERVALTTGREQPRADDADRMALACYARAMDHVGVMANDPAFRWLDRVILDLHFDACYFQKDHDPGRYRRVGIEVMDPGGGDAAAFVGPSADDVPPLMDAVVDWLAHGDLRSHVVVRAAMAHLHVVSVHPFRDGNGRISRIVQSLVLAREGLLAPEFVSIEEYLGASTDAYYATLQKVQGGGYRPERDAAPWVRFCVDAHVKQAQQRLEQLSDAADRWNALEALVEARGWPDRLVIALEQSLFDGVDRSSYVAEAGISLPQASIDLRRLVDAELVDQRGQGRKTRYVASDRLRDAVAR